MLTVLPDVETVMVQALNARAAVTAICGNRIGTRIADAPTFPLIRLAKVAETFTDEEGSESSLVQIECWAADDATASLLARTVVASRKDMPGMYAAGWLALVDVSSGPVPAPDPDSERARYMLTLEVETGA